MAEETNKSNETQAAGTAREGDTRPPREGAPRPAREGDSRPAREGDRRPAGRDDRGGRRGGGGSFRRRKFCKFCADTSLKIDYKDPELLRHYVTERYKIVPARVTGTCARHQRAMTTAVKRARVLALLPFTTQHRD